LALVTVVIQGNHPYVIIDMGLAHAPATRASTAAKASHSNYIHTHGHDRAGTFSKIRPASKW